MVFSKLTKTKENTVSIEQEYSTKAKQIETFFGKVCGQYAHESGLVERQSPLTGSKLAQGLILGSLKTPTATLNQFCQVLDDLGIDISESGLHYRLNAQTVVFMEKLTKYALDHWYEKQAIPIDLLRRFSAIWLTDSSQIRLSEALAAFFSGSGRGNAKASMKVTVSYEFISGRFEAIEVEAGKHPDQINPVMKQAITAGMLVICDLGFFNQNLFAEFDQKDVYFLSRLKLQAGLYEQEDSPKQIDLSQILPDTVGACGEFKLYLGSQKRVAVRLIYERLPDKIVAQRRRKAKADAKKRGKTCQQWVLDMLAWSLYVSNVPEAIASPEELILLYRLRWQIELVFKLWKSYAKLNVMGNWRVERVLCQFYARLLGLLLFQWLAIAYRWTSDGELSLPKAFKFLQAKADSLIIAIQVSWHEVDKQLQLIQDMFRRFALKQKRRNKTSTLEQLFHLSEH